ncbi:MAG: hypothetical protein ACRDYF_16590 [Acidimicrobiia bacterium]
MALDERARHELFLRLEQILGAESAETLMEMLPPVGWADVATKRDLDALEERMNLRFEAQEQRFQLVDQRFDALERHLDQRFEGWEHKLLAAFREELLAQSNVIGAQTRALIKANLGTVVSLAALAFAVARLT